MLTLGDLHIGQDAIIRVVGGEGELRHHLLDTMRHEHCYSPYYLPCRWNSLRLLWMLSEAARTQSPLFGKLDWAGYYLLLGRMKRG